MGQDDDDDFLRALADVVPLRNRDRRVQKSPPSTPIRIARRAPIQETTLTPVFDIQTGFDEDNATPFLHGAAPGVNRQLVLSLARGDIRYHQQMDLHGLLLEQAKLVFHAFIVRMRRQGERCILVITGRGKSSPGGISVIRDAVPQWLSKPPLSDMVLAFTTANRHDGGPGAFYVLLRKSDRLP